MKKSLSLNERKATRLEIEKFVKRNNDWLVSKKRRIDNMRKSQERVETKQCTFVPNSAKI